MIKTSMQKIAIAAIKNLNDIESYLLNDPALRDIWPDYDQILKEFPEYKKMLMNLLNSIGYDVNLIEFKNRNFKSLAEIRESYANIFKPLQDFAYDNADDEEYKSELDVFGEIGSCVFSRYISFAQKFRRDIYRS